MTVKELKDALRLYPDNMDVFMAQRQTDFPYGLVNSIRMENIAFREEDGGALLARDNVVIIDEA